MITSHQSRKFYSIYRYNDQYAVLLLWISVHVASKFINISTVFDLSYKELISMVPVIDLLNAVPDKPK